MTATAHLVVAPRASLVLARRPPLGLVAFVLALLVSVGAVASEGLADRGGASASTSAAGLPTTYTVQPGDTLWAIAQRVAPGADVAGFVDALVALNGGTVIVPGQVLRLP